MKAKNKKTLKTAKSKKVRKRIPARGKTVTALQGDKNGFKVIVDNAGDGIVINTAPDGKIVYVNKRAAEITGYSIEELLKTTIKDHASPDRFTADMEIYTQTLKGIDHPGQFETAIVHKNGRVIPLEMTATLVDWRGQKAVAVIVRDITERKLAENIIGMERDKIQKYLDIAGGIFITIDRQQKVSSINKKGCQILGYDNEDDIIGKNWFETFIPERISEQLIEVFERLMQGEIDIAEYFENPVLTIDGRERIILWHNTVLKDEKGNIYATLSSGNDITELRQTIDELNRYQENLEEVVRNRTHELTNANTRLEQEIAERRNVDLELKKLLTVIEHSINLIFITDANGTIEYVNPMFEQVTGYSKKEIIGKNPRIFASGDTLKVQYEELWNIILAGKIWSGLFKNKKKNGEYYWVKAIISPVMDEEGNIIHFLGVQEDITEKRVSKERLQYLTHYDGTTGLINRARLIELLDEWISNSQSGDESGVLILIDLDQFKFISDTFGYGMGDEFLRRVARLLQTNLRYLDAKYIKKSTMESVLCRLSGDEFAIFLPAAGRAEGMIVAEQARKAIEDFYQPDVSCHLTASIGIAVYPDHAKTTSDLLTKADISMFRAKELGRNRCHIYNSDERYLEHMHSRLKWKENILHAIKENRFEAWFQPILDLSDDSVHHYEVLARMRDNDGRIIMPGPFIDIAERFGLLGAIGRVIIEKALIDLSDLVHKGSDLTFCLNISGRELGDDEFLYFLQSKIHELGVPPNRLIFEITETSSINDMDAAIKFLKALKLLGCHMALDDFGIGFTSFLYLKELHIDYVKIAGPFIKNINKNLNDQLFVKAIADVARGMNIKTIAEFAEDDETIKLLKEYGIDYAQGYIIGKPCPTLDYKSCSGVLAT